MARINWKRVDPRTWERTIEPSRGFLRLSLTGGAYAVAVHCERFVLSLPGFTERSLERAKRRATRDLAELRSVLAGVGEDRCPF
jgi:hypothetical protein